MVRVLANGADWSVFKTACLLDLKQSLFRQQKMISRFLWFSISLFPHAALANQKRTKHRLAYTLPTTHFCSYTGKCEKDGESGWGFHNMLHCHADT